MKKLTVLLALGLILSTFGCAGAAQSNTIQASGQIEAKQIAVAPELSGRIVEVLVNEGDSVKAGDLLFRMDDELLLSQKRAAQAALESAQAGVQAAQAALDSAQAQVDLTLSGALAAEQPNRQTAWKQTKPGEFDQPVWYFSQTEQIAAMQTEIDTSRSALDEAQARLEQTEQKAGNAAFLQVEKRLSDTRTAFVIAKVVLDHTTGAGDSASLRDSAQTAFDKAKADLKNAQKDYDDALTTDGAKDVLKARAEVAVARERYNSAMDGLRALQTGENSLDVVVAGKAVDQAKSTREQAQFAVSAAQANLDLIDTQLSKLDVRAPMDGVILVRSIEAGEVIQAGMPALTVGNLDPLKVTVYIPETQYGQVMLGQQASLSVDSYPDKTFPAVVTRIADQAEFTPQNVQTKEGRQTTVYAVELSVNNADGQLKPGMPVDVTFASGQ